MKCAACVTGSNTMTNSAGSCTDICALLAGAELDRIDGDLFQDLFEAGLRQIDAGAPENLAEVFPHRQHVRIVRRDPAHPRADREGDLDHLVERRLVGLRAQRAVVGLLVHRLELQARIEHAAAARAQHVPVQLEQAEPRGVQEGADDLLLVEPALGGERQHVDADRCAVLAVADQRLDRGEHRRDRPTCAARRTERQGRSWQGNLSLIPSRARGSVGKNRKSA